MGVHRPKYSVEYRKGRAARLEGLPESACPFGVACNGQRMSWLAGWWDCEREQATA